MVEAFEVIHECAGNKTAPVEHFFVDGDLIERCFLKTLCGGLYSGNFLVPPEDKLRGIEPPREWIDVLYKGAELTEPQGLYLKQLQDGEVIETSKFQLSIIPLFSADEKVCGLLMWLYGFEFTLLLCGLQPGVKTQFDESA